MDTNNANMETGNASKSLPCSPDVGPVCSPKENRSRLLNGWLFCRCSSMKMTCDRECWNEDCETDMNQFVNDLKYIQQC